jgi:hypothetical protein
VLKKAHPPSNYQFSDVSKENIRNKQYNKIVYQNHISHHSNQDFVKIIEIHEYFKFKNRPFKSIFPKTNLGKLEIHEYFKLKNIFHE